MRYQVVGKGKRRQGTAKETKKPYDGESIYCIRNDPEVEGSMTEEVYFNHLLGISFPSVNINDIINVVYDSKGFMREVSVEKSAKG